MFGLKRAIAVAGKSQKLRYLRRRNGYTDGQMDGRMDGQRDRQTNGWMDEPSYARAYVKRESKALEEEERLFTTEATASKWLKK